MMSSQWLILSQMSPPIQQPVEAIRGDSQCRSFRSEECLAGWIPSRGLAPKQYLQRFRKVSPVTVERRSQDHFPRRHNEKHKCGTKNENALLRVTGIGSRDSTRGTPDGRLISNPTKTLEQLNPVGLAAPGIVPVTKTVVIESLTAIDPLLEKVEGVCVVGNNIVLTYDNDFNVGEEASIPANPNPNGPFVELELVGANFPKIFVVPMP